MIRTVIISLSVFFWCNSPPVGQGLFIHKVSTSHIEWHTTVSRTPLDEWSACCRDLYLTKHTHTTLTTDKVPCPWWDWNPQSHQVSGCRLMP